MKRPQLSARLAAHWLAPLCLVLAFQLSTQPITQVIAIQQANEQHNAPEHSVGPQTGPMLSMGSESSSALESSAALAGDDLIAAESSQSPAEPAEHKAFTSAQIIRQQQQDQQQMAASVAPVFVAPTQQQQQQAGPQPQQHQPQQQQQQMFGGYPPHMAALQARIPHQPQQQKPFNPFMAAALAGNYGPAQQQIAAAAAASMHAVQQQSRVHPQPPHAVAHQQQMVAPHPQQQQQQAHPHAGMVPHGAGPHPMASHAPHQQHQQQHPRPQQQIAGGGEQPSPTAMAVQESSVRNNVVPAPNQFNSMVESNSIELNDAPQVGGQQQQSGSQQSAGIGSSSQAMAVASSAQHPVIAAASSSMQESAASAWPLQAPDIPKIVNLEVKCEKNLMKVSIEFDKVFNGVIFSKGHYNQGQCVHVGQNSGKQQAYFDISINSCGTQGNTQNGLYGMGGNTGSGTYFENTIVVQYDPNVQEVYDHARKLRCTWHDQYEKAVTFRPFPVDMLDIVRADFAGDNVGCWMQIQVGKGPWASEVAGIVKIGQTMTMVLAIKDEENKFDMLVRNCFAHDGKRGPIELVDKSGCITRPKLMSRFTKIKNFGSSATVLSYAHFQAFKFPDSMEVHFQCTIQICRHQCPEQCSAGPNTIGGSNGESYSESTISGTFNIHGSQGAQAAAASSSASAADSVHLRKYGSSQAGLSRERRDVRAAAGNGSHPSYGHHQFRIKPMTQNVGLNRVIQVVSTGDLAFAIQQQQSQQQIVNGSTGDEWSPNASQLTRVVDLSNQICMSSYNFVLALVVLVLILLCSCLIAVSLYMRQKSFAKRSTSKLLVPSPLSTSSSGSSSCCSSPVSTLRHHVPSQQQQLYTNQNHLVTNYASR